MSNYYLLKSSSLLIRAACCCFSTTRSKHSLAKRLLVCYNNNLNATSSNTLTEILQNRKSLPYTARLIHTSRTRLTEVGKNDSANSEFSHVADIPSIDEFDEFDTILPDEMGGNVEDPNESSNNLPGVRIRGILCPTLETHSSDVDGQRYDQLPVAHVSATYQNTLISITDYSGTKTYSIHSGGTVGFKNAKKKTNVAAQAAGKAAGDEALSKGLKHIRVAISGMGKGRLAACTGLEQAGLQIVSLTDSSTLDWGARMPRKRRRL